MLFYFFLFIIRFVLCVSLAHTHTQTNTQTHMRMHIYLQRDTHLYNDFFESHAMPLSLAHRSYTAYRMG